jgi:hypothetical protein
MEASVYIFKRAVYGHAGNNEFTKSWLVDLESMGISIPFS